MSDSDLESYDWANEMQYLQRSSEHGSDGEIYIPEPTQQDEMKRGYLRCLNRQREEERADESPCRTLQSTAAASGTVISLILLYQSGPLDSQTESQVYISGLFRAAEQSIHAQSQPSSPVLSTLADDWKAGAKAASEFLYSHGIDFDFIEALSAPNVDFLCPNGVDYPAVPSSSSSIP
ncbi:hypothetical protein C8J57DRAFT_1406860, partial [Mycena rebaudengoi]